MQAWDRFAYSNNNAVRYTDPTGHMVDDGCRDTGCNAKKGEEYRDYVYNVIYGDVDKKANAEIAEQIMVGTTEVALGIVAPPLALLYQTINGEQISGLNIAFAVLPGSLKFTADQAALISLSKTAKKTGVTMDEAITLLEWASEYQVKAAGPEQHLTRLFNILHIRIGPVNHIPIVP